jgi:hypothetical protein
MRNCTFKNWQWTGSDKQRRYLIHQYSGDSLCFINPTFINCGGKGALIYREANSVSAMIGWKDIDFNNQSTAVFSGVNFTAGALNGRGEKLVNE